MMKRMEQNLQENAEVSHVNKLERLEQPKNNPKDVMTFHNGEQNELNDVIKNTKSKTVRPTGNHPPKLQHIKTKLETPRNRCGTLPKKRKLS